MNASLPPEVVSAARSGRRLFPLQPRSKIPLPDFKWKALASSDLSQLEAWFRNFPNCNWAIVLESEDVVIDIDGDLKAKARGLEHNGQWYRAELEKQGFLLPETYTVYTGDTPGQHLYYRLPTNARRLRNNSDGLIAELIDVKTVGGYAVWWGVHSDTGNPYVHGLNAERALLPQWVVERFVMTESRPVSGQADGVVAAVDGVTERHCSKVRKGGRTNHLVSLAGTMNKRGMDPRAIEAALLEENGAKCDPPLNKEKVKAIAHDIPARYPQVTGATDKPALEPVLLCLADVEARPVKWLWEPYIPARMLSMVSGDPGAGKSFIALSVSAELSRGRLLDGRIVEPSNTLYLSVENPIAEQVRPRIDALGGDPARLFMIKTTITLADLATLDTAIEKLKARLVVVDPIQSYLGAGVDLHRSNETRPIMDGLAGLAEKHGCAVLILRHLSKQNGGKAIQRGLGSIDLTGAVRSEMLVGSLPDDPDARAMVHIKSNVGRLGNSLGFAIDSGGHFAWTGESGLSASDLLAAPTGTGDNKLSEAREWLAELLGSGGREADEVGHLAKGAGISDATLRRAKSKLGVQARKAGYQGRWMWYLPNGAHTENLNSFGELSTLEEKQPTRVAL
jgi:hypothetical protein